MKLLLSFSIFIGIFLISEHNVHAQDNNTSNYFDDKIELDTIISFPNLNVYTSLLEEYSYFAGENMFCITNYSQVLRTSNINEMKIYIIRSNYHLDSISLIIPQKIVEKNIRINSFYVSDSIILIAFYKKLLIYKFHEANYKHYKTIRTPYLIQSISSIGSHFYFSKIYNTRRLLFPPANSYIKRFSLRQRRITKTIDLPFRFIEFSHLLPHNWISSNTDHLFYSQTSDYEIESLNEDLLTHQSIQLSKANWTQMPDTIRLLFKGKSTRELIDCASAYNDSFSRIITLSASDSLLLVRYQNKRIVSNCFLPQYFYDIYKKNEEGFYSLVEEDLYENLMPGKNVISDKENMPFQSWQFSDFEVIDKRIFQMRSGYIINPIGITNDEFIRRREKEALTGNAKMNIYVFRIKEI
jgi:hypothetical protein